MSEEETTTAIDDYRAALQAVVLARTMLAQYDFNKLLRAIDRAEAIGPIFNPTLYRDKAGAMLEDADLFRAAARFVAGASKGART